MALDDELFGENEVWWSGYPAELRTIWLSMLVL